MSLWNKTEEIETQIADEVSVKSCEDVCLTGKLD